MKITLGKDFSTIDECLSALRAYRSVERILDLGNEDMFITSPIELDERDSGTTVIGGGWIFGGVKLSEIRFADGYITAKLPDGADPAALIANGRFCPRARFPEVGELNYRTRCDLVWQGSAKGGWNIPPTKKQLTELEIDPRDIPPGCNLVDAYITVYHEWDESTVRIRSFDRESGKIVLQSELEHPAGAFGKTRYAISGIREGLTRRGSWYLDKKRSEIVYLPLENESIDDLVLIAPIAESALRITNAVGIRLIGLKISACNGTHGRSGLRAANCPGAIQTYSTQNTVIDGVQISSTAAHGIRMLKSEGAVITNCRIENCGAGGIFQHECGTATIKRNEIISIGRSTASAIGIHAGGKSMLLYVLDGGYDVSGSVEISNNTVTDTPYCAITCNGGPHKIRANVIDRSMLTLMDGAAIYSSRADRTEITENRITRLADGRENMRGIYGIYYDEGTANSVICKNTIENARQPIHFHYSKDVLIKNNVMTSDGDVRFLMAHSYGIHLFENSILAKGKIDFITNNTRDEPFGFENSYVCKDNEVFSGCGIYEKADVSHYGEPTKEEYTSLDAKLIRARSTTE